LSILPFLKSKILDPFQKNIRGRGINESNDINNES
jgi:hypothetical protein